MGKLVIETASTCCILSLEKGNVFVTYRIPALRPLPSFKNRNLSVMSTYIALLSPDMNQLCVQQSLQCG